MLRREVETQKEQLSCAQADKRHTYGDLVSVRKECRQTKVPVAIMYSIVHFMYAT